MRDISGGGDLLLAKRYAPFAIRVIHNNAERLEFPRHSNIIGNDILGTWWFY